MSIFIPKVIILHYIDSMSERNKRTEAIILTLKTVGEDNKLVTYFSRENGICQGMLFGGPRSKLRSMVQPFNTGTLYLYNDESKKSSKITDFDVKDFHLDLRQNLYKIMAADLAGEILLKTRCAGDYENSYILFSAFLTGIDLSTEEEARLGTLRFLWRYICLLGQQPDLHLCKDCGEFLLSKEYDSFYIHHKNGFICHECIKNYNSEDKIFSMDKYALTYLAAINELSPGQVRKLQIGASSAYQIKNFVFSLISYVCGGKLKTLEDGHSIL